MGIPVCAGATVQCSFGQAPSVLNVPAGQVTCGTPLVKASDFVPFTNVQPFGACMSLANPTVAAATAAAQGVLTPQPCAPQTVSPWVPGGPVKVTATKLPIVQNTDTLLCLWGGVIRVVTPGQTLAVVK